MIRRLFIAASLVSATLTGVAFQVNVRDDVRPGLLVFSSSTCGPCRQFSSDYGNSPWFRDQLVNQYDCNSAYTLPKHKARYDEFDVHFVPTFILVDGKGREIGRTSGYTTASQLLQDLKSLQRSHAPPAQRAPPAQQPEIRAPRPLEANPTDSELLQRISDANRKLSEERDHYREAMEQLERQRVIEAERSDHESKAAVASVERRTAEQIKQLQAESAATILELNSRIVTLNRTLQSQQVLQEDNDDWLQDVLVESSGPATSISAGDISTEISSATETGNQWLKVGRWVAATAIQVAAPQIAIPGTAGLAVLGFGISWLRNRKQRTPKRQTTIASSTSDSGTIRVDTERRQTENHYVVKETDIEGEALREAIRRVVAARKSDAPGIVDVAKQIEHVASEIIKGKRMTERPSKQPRPGIWEDPDQHRNS